MGAPAKQHKGLKLSDAVINRGHNSSFSAFLGGPGVVSGMLPCITIMSSSSSSSLTSSVAAAAAASPS